MLPDTPRPPWISSFWSVLSVFTALGLEIAGWLLFEPSRLGYGVATALAMMVMGRVWPALPRATYRKWNALTRFGNRGLRFAVIAVCYHMVVGPVSWLGSRMKVEAGRDAGTLWQPRAAAGSASYFHPYEEAGATGGGGPWSRAVGGGGPNTVPQPLRRRCAGDGARSAEQELFVRKLRAAR